MKVYINNYKHHWISPYTICEKVCFWREINYDEPWVKRTSDILEPVMVFVQKVWDFIDPKINYVKVDGWDTYSMDSTLAHIILPMLKQLRDGKHSHGMVADEDAPEEIGSKSPGARDGLTNEYDWDNYSEKRWDYILNEMIWSFEQLLNDDAEGQFFDYTTHNNKMPWQEGYVGPKYDKEGHDLWYKRKSNGFRLFGKYYESLWS